MIKQLAAIVASGDRTDEVRAIKAPTLVIHGRDDPLVPLKTARKPQSASLAANRGDHRHGTTSARCRKITQKVLAHFRQTTRAAQHQ